MLRCAQHDNSIGVLLPIPARPDRPKDLSLHIHGWLEIGEIPLACQALGAGFAGGFRELAQVGRIVDVESDAGERQNYALLLRGARGR